MPEVVTTPNTPPVAPTVKIAGLSGKALLEERGKLGREIDEFRKKTDAHNRLWNAEEERQWAQINADYEFVATACSRAQQSEKILSDLTAPASDPVPGREDRGRPAPGREGEFNGRGQSSAPTDADYAMALQGWLLQGAGRRLSNEHQEATRRCNVDPQFREIGFELRRDTRQMRAEYFRKAYRAQSININPDGGYLVAQGFMPTLEVALLQYSQIRQVADVMRTDGIGEIPWPTVNDTANKGHIIAENKTVSENKLPFGQMILRAYKYTSDEVLVPNEWLEDSAINLAEKIGDMLGVRLARGQNDDFTTGSGAGRPKGIVTAATVGVTTASASAIAADEIYNLKHSVDPSYRPGAIWMFHDQILLAIKKLKDNYGRYLWQSSIADGAPSTFDGDPIMINQSMASSISALNITMLYGQMFKYKIRDAGSVRLVRLFERYADADQQAFLAFLRSDANLLDAGTHPVKSMQQHS